MKAALVSMKVRAGYCRDNVARMKHWIKQAKADGADLILFPQNAVSGYLLQELWLEDDWCRYVDSFNDELIAMSDDIAIVWGNIRYRNRRRFNAAFFAYQRQTHMRVRRHERLLYSEDTRYFEESPINSAIVFKDKVMALNFGFETALADLNLNIDARAYSMDKTPSWKGDVLYVNASGVQSYGGADLLMSGGAYYVKNGICKQYGRLFGEEEYRIVEVDMKHEAVVKKPAIAEGLRMELAYFQQQHDATLRLADIPMPYAEAGKALLKELPDKANGVIRTIDTYDRLQLLIEQSDSDLHLLGDLKVQEIRGLLRELHLPLPLQDIQADRWDITDHLVFSRRGRWNHAGLHTLEKLFPDNRWLRYLLQADEKTLAIYMQEINQLRRQRLACRFNGQIPIFHEDSCLLRTSNIAVWDDY